MSGSRDHVPEQDRTHVVAGVPAASADDGVRDAGPRATSIGSVATASETAIPFTEVGRDPAYDVPDRIAGYDGLAELRESCRGRDWRFVTVDVTTEVRQMRPGMQKAVGTWQLTRQGVQCSSRAGD